MPAGQPSQRSTRVPDVVCGELRAENGFGNSARLLPAQPEVVGADLQELAVRAETPERQSRLGSRRDYELDVPWEVLEEEVERGVPELVVGELIVVEDDHPVAGHVGKRFQESRQHAADEVVRIEVDADGPRAFELRRGLADRPDQMRPQAYRVGVVSVEGEPRDGTVDLLLLSPLGEERRLSIAGRSADQSQRVLPTGIEKLEQAWPRHVARRHPRCLHLRTE